MKNFKYTVAILVGTCFGVSASDDSDAWLKQAQHNQAGIASFQEGIYTVKKLGWDTGVCGSLRLTNHNGAIRLSDFSITDGEYQNTLKDGLFHKKEETKQFGEKAPYSIPYGEAQISQFVLYHMTNATYDLADLSAQQARFGASVEWDSGNDMNKMHVRLILNENGKDRHALYVEYPYQLNSIGAAQRFNIEFSKDS